MSAPREIVVVGASLAGLRAVESLRRRGYGERLVLVGEETRRPYDRPPLSKQVLRGEWEPERTELKARYDTLGIELRLGCCAVSLDTHERRVTLSDGEKLSYDALVIATGAAARNLPGGEALAGVHTLRTWEDAVAIRAALTKNPRVAIVGAGFIGLEVAASCRTLGLDVTVVELAEVPLAHAIGEEMGRAVTELHRARGVRMRTGVSVLGFLGEREASGLRLSDGTTVDAELVVVGIGVVPATAWLAGSGVEVSAGVVCDARGRTNVPGVVACGDVARWENPLFGEALRVEHWTSAVEQAAACAQTLLEGGAAPALASVPYFWSDQYDAKFQFAGKIAPTDTLTVVEGSVAEKNLVALYGSAGKLRGVLTVNKPAALIRNRKAIGEGAELPT
jgi:3-phenylpropionate/trans-cinnamate dioxygenase ferredoxin reductase subunit